MVLRILDISESTYYARKKREVQPTPSAATGQRGRPLPGHTYTFCGIPKSDEEIKERLMEFVEGEEHVYGYKMLTECLRDDPYKLKINKKKVYRLCKELGILQKAWDRKSPHPRRLPKNRLITGRNQLWQMDIKYGYAIGVERFFFVLSIIDVFDRVVVGQYRGAACKASHAVQTLNQALQDRITEGEPMPVIRTDNGPQFVSQLFGDMCESLGMEHERIPPRTPDLNAYIESFHSILERNLFRRKTFMTLEEAYKSLDTYMDFYNNRRKHGSLRNMPPARYSEWIMTLEDTTSFHKAM
ncbi:IS3 family transposase [Paenibacillus sp. PL2-23]|uniref:IS3 family transposase n=1 Tax=Paenibacillus sp. PL2-23 TaxID=2100729 RepID=UPI00349E4CB9